MVVGSSHGDVSKYVGEGVALRRTPGLLWVYCGHGSPILWPFLGNFLWAHLGCAVSEARHLIFGHYIIKECCDIICDVTAPHVHRSCDLLL